MKHFIITITLLAVVIFLNGCATIERGIETAHDMQRAAGQVPIAQIHVTNGERTLYAGVERLGYNEDMIVLEPGQSTSFTVVIYKENLKQTVRVKFYEYDPRKKDVDFKEVRENSFWFSSYNNDDQTWNARIGW